MGDDATFGHAPARSWQTAKMRTITNHYRDARVLNLGTEGKPGPFLVIQVGTAPHDELFRERMFVLRPDGQWVDFNAYASKGQAEAMDEIVFPSLHKIIEIFGNLKGTPQILSLPVDAAGLEAWIARQKSSDPVQNALAWAAQYKRRHDR
jgi:hypothetical protein